MPVFWRRRLESAARCNSWSTAVVMRGVETNMTLRKQQAHGKYAHAGSRTRVTSMGGLYDAATLHALVRATLALMASPATGEVRAWSHTVADAWLVSRPTLRVRRARSRRLHLLPPRALSKVRCVDHAGLARGPSHGPRRAAISAAQKRAFACHFQAAFFFAFSEDAVRGVRAYPPSPKCIPTSAIV